MRPWRLPKTRNGFSLIEVIASLLLMGTLLVSVLTAHRRNVQQMIRGEKRLAAVAALDQLLTERSDPSAPTEDENKNAIIPDHENLYWRSLERFDTAAANLGAVVLRIEVYDPNYQAGETLAWVEMLAESTTRRGR